MKFIDAMVELSKGNCIKAIKYDLILKTQGHDIMIWEEAKKQWKKLKNMKVSFDYIEFELCKNPDVETKIKPDDFDHSTKIEFDICMANLTVQDQKIEFLNDTVNRLYRAVVNIELLVEAYLNINQKHDTCIKLPDGSEGTPKRISKEVQDHFSNNVFLDQLKKERLEREIENLQNLDFIA